MLTAEQKQQIETIRQFPQAVREAVAGLSSEQLTATPIGGEWSVAQIVHHCGDSHVNYYIRLKMILTADNPPIQPYDEAVWGEFPDARDGDFTHTFNILDGIHARWLHAFSSIDGDAWERIGTHGSGKIWTPASTLTSFANHCQAHLAQIETTKAAF